MHAKAPATLALAKRKTRKKINEEYRHRGRKAHRLAPQSKLGSRDAAHIKRQHCSTGYSSCCEAEQGLSTQNTLPSCADDAQPGKKEM